MKTYAKVLIVPEGKAKSLVSSFPQEARFVETDTLVQATVVELLNSALTYISFSNNGVTTYALIENTSLQSVIK